MTQHKPYHNKRRHPAIVRPRLTVTAAECRGDADKMVRKFIKKAKKEKIVEEYRERSRYKPRSVVRAERKRQRERIIKKHNLRMKELFR